MKINKRWICQGSSIPSGWMVTSKRRTTQCQQGYEMEITNTNNMPIGAELWMCQGSPVPNGWSQVEFDENRRCGGLVEIPRGMSRMRKIG